MELNVKNCLGPSPLSIPTAFMEQTAWLDEAIEIDADGMADHRTSEELVWVQRRVDQLEDLMNLMLPPPGLAWGCCGHDDEETDLMGLHHGRNE